MKFHNKQSRPGLGSVLFKTDAHAFSRVDLLVVILLVVLLSFWFGLSHLGERGRIVRCAGNLAMLGKAMQSYANEHDDMLPAADIWLQKASISWDSKIFPYLEPGVLKANNDRLFAKGEALFFCPSDLALHNGIPRSYAMAANDMSPANWPPGPNSVTGVGLWWDGNSTPPLLGNEAKEYPDSLPGLKLSILPAPADTLLLTEFIGPNNVVGSVFQTVVWGIGQQRSFFNGEVVNFHHGKFNYLMADGHVELLSPLQTGTPDRFGGIWTIKKGD
jgi:prepilin-type processing-associated H-X9-DG protein